MLPSVPRGRCPRRRPDSGVGQGWCAFGHHDHRDMVSKRWKSLRFSFDLWRRRSGIGVARRSDDVGGIRGWRRLVVQRRGGRRLDPGWCPRCVCRRPEPNLAGAADDGRRRVRSIPSPNVGRRNSLWCRVACGSSPGVEHIESCRQRLRLHQRAGHEF